MRSRLARPFTRFNIETLTTTDRHVDAGTSSGDRLRLEGPHPAHLSDAVVHRHPGWIDHIDRLSEVSGIDAATRRLHPPEQRRQAFSAWGQPPPIGPTSPQTLHLSQNEAQAIFAQAHGEATPEDAALLPRTC